MDVFAEWSDEVVEGKVTRVQQSRTKPTGEMSRNRETSREMLPPAAREARMSDQVMGRSKDQSSPVRVWYAPRVGGMDKGPRAPGNMYKKERQESRMEVKSSGEGICRYSLLDRLLRWSVSSSSHAALIWETLDLDPPE